MLKHDIKNISGLYLLIWVVLIPFPFYVIPDIGGWIGQFIQVPLDLIAESAFPDCRSCIWDVLSDSHGMYLLAFLSVPASVLVHHLIRAGRWHAWISDVLLFFLAIHLAKYGIEKILYQQFTAPEANLLYTPLGYLEKDILYWSTIGSSYFYNICVGIIELSVAIMLLFNKSRNIALLLSIGAMMHVFIINISFDIDVKLFSLTILLIALYLSHSTLKNLARGLRTGSIILHTNRTKRASIQKAFKRAAILLMVAECAYPLYYKLSHSSQQNNTQAMAYEVIGDPQVSRIFYHSSGYLIAQGHDLRLSDERAIPVQDGFYMPEQMNAIKFNTSTDRLCGIYAGRSVEWEVERLDISELPLLQDRFEWTVQQPLNSIEDYPP